MKKLIIALALLLGGSAAYTPQVYAAPDAPMCSLDDPCLYDGFAYNENGSGLKILVKRNKNGQLIALVNGDINKALQCMSVPNLTKYCVNYNGYKYYFSFS